MTGVSPEVCRATLAARCIVLAVAASLLAAALLTVVQKAIAVPELAHGILRDETTVQIEMLPPPPVKKPMVEHLAEKSDVQVDAKPEPVKEEPPKAQPKPEPKPQPLPAAKPQPAKKPVKKPVPVKKDLSPTPQESKASEGTPAPAANSGGKAAAPVQGTASGQSAEARSKALAEIIAVIDAHKRYPRRARQTGAEGDVVLAVTIDATGTVTNVILKTPNPSVLLNRAALKAAEPLIGRKLPLAQALTVEVPVRFTISS